MDKQIKKLEEIEIELKGNSEEELLLHLGRNLVCLGISYTDKQIIKKLDRF